MRNAPVHSLPILPRVGRKASSRCLGGAGRMDSAGSGGERGGSGAQEAGAERELLLLRLLPRRLNIKDRLQPGELLGGSGSTGSLGRRARLSLEAAQASWC